jgi:3-deoxy-D-manno-octulosonic-acid transferase
MKLFDSSFQSKEALSNRGRPNKKYLILYNLVVIPFLFSFFQVARFFNGKIKQGILGRHRLFTELKHGISRWQLTQPRIWIHAVSLGEFEQARPIIRELKIQFPQVRILQTFFSPSGYENVRCYPGVDYISYIPFDSYKNAKKFVEIVRPKAAIFVRWDLWPNHLWALKKQRIFTVLINASIHKNSLRNLRLLRGFNQNLFRCLDQIFAVSDNAKQRLAPFIVQSKSLSVSGDTRCDQVWSRSLEKFPEESFLKTKLKNKKVFIAGSTWLSDEKRLLPAIRNLSRKQQDFISILVPHEPTANRLQQVEKELQNLNLSSVRFTHIRESKHENVRIILVDKIGLLALLYKLADVAFVGGSFGPGIHNILEAAVYGVPILFGPQMNNAWEAEALLQLGAAFKVKDSMELFETLERLILNPKDRIAAGEIGRQWVINHKGATNQIIKAISNHLPELEKPKLQNS